MKKTNIYRIAITLHVILSGCKAQFGVAKSQEFDSRYGTSSVDRYIKSSLGNELTDLIKRIEMDDLNAWKTFASLGSGLDGENSQTYSIACAELARRDPTFYLRRYLIGDHSAIPCAKKSYSWSGTRGRSVLDAVFAERLYIATNPQEHKAIKTFITETAVWKKP